MACKEVAVETPDGRARAFLCEPEGQGPWPAAIMYMDAPGIRPALTGMAERLASNGYVVLLPDMFWRAGPYGPLDVKAAFADEAKRREIFTRLMPSTGPERVVRDTQAFLDYLAAQPSVRPGPIGVAGYCMGGAMALRAAAAFPDRVAAAASFHGGNLATDAPDSPHRLAPKMKAQVLVAGADHDEHFDEAQKDRLAKALKDAGVQAEVTIYPGARHGYAPPDMPVYDREASERHWREMLALFDATLKR